jgi:hypothetical protein
MSQVSARVSTAVMSRRNSWYVMMNAPFGVWRLRAVTAVTRTGPGGNSWMLGASNTVRRSHV